MWNELQKMHNDVDKLFGNFLESEMPGRPRKAISDVWEDDKNIYAEIELPGVTKDDIKINANERGVEIKVEKEDSSEKKEKDSFISERSYAGFYRNIPFSQEIDANNIEANFKNGVLSLKAPKVQSSRKQIEIKEG